MVSKKQNNTLPRDNHNVTFQAKTLLKNTVCNLVKNKTIYP